MALVGRRDGRNFGYGRQLSYAGPQALKDLFGGGHYGTVKAHGDRWLAFVRWCRSEHGPGFNDARQIDRQTLLDYTGHLRQQVEQGELAIATAQNRLSSVNRTMAALRGDQYVKVPSPSKALRMRRTTVRRSVPQGQDREQVKRIVDVLCEHQLPRAAAIAQLARATGMRLREAILADLPRLKREAEHYGKMNIQDGTKGGRAGASAPRWITVNDHIRDALAFAHQASPDGMRANAMSKSPTIPPPSTVAIAINSTDVSIRKPEYKSAMSWGTTVSSWWPLTLVVAHEHGIRYGSVPDGRPDRVAYHAPTPPASGEGHPNSDR